MIHLDTNALIALPHWANQSHPLMSRVQRGEAVAACSWVWYEYLSGPIEEAAVQMAGHFIGGRILAVDGEHARLASELFNLTGRRRALRTDTLIAAVAISSGAELLTLNTQDFLPFVPHGLKLMSTRSSR